MKDHPPAQLHRGLVPALALVGLGIVTLFWPVFFEGKVMVAGDIPFSDPFWYEEAPAEYDRPQNPVLADQISQFYIWHLLASRSVREEGAFPLWNPYVFTGQPLVANAQSSLFYPPNLLLAWLTPGQVANIRNILNLLIAGAFTFLFCRELRISPGGSILSALGFTFSGPVLVWLGFPLMSALVWLPLMLWAGEKLLGPKVPLVWVGILGLSVGMSILGGHPETSFHVLVVLVLYVLVRLLLIDSNLQSKMKVLAAVFVAVILGMAIGGIQLLPFADFVLQSSTLSQRARFIGGIGWIYSKEWWFHLVTVVTLLYPNFFGNPASYNYQWPFDNLQNYNEQTFYLGLVPLALAAGALFAFRKRRRVIAVAVVALFCIGVAWRTPGIEFINHLPVFSAVLNERLKMPFVLLVAVLAGFGYDGIRQQVLDQDRRWKRSLLIPSGVILFATLGILMIIAFAKYVGPLLFEIDPNTFRYHWLYRIFSFRQIKTMIPAAVAGAALLGYGIVSRHSRLRRGYGYLLIALTMTELLVLGWGYSPLVEESKILPPVQEAEVLKGDGEPFRILSTDWIFWPNYPAAYGIADVGGYDLPVYARYSDLYTAQGGVEDHRQIWQPDWPLVDLMNVRYIITPQELEPERFVPLYRTEDYRIYENRQAMPRAFLVYDVAVIEDESAMLERMLDDAWSPGKTVLLEEPLPMRESAALGGESSSAVDFVKYGHDHVILEVLTEQPGILVLSDLYSKDWQARVDSEPVDLHRANYTYRAVFVPEGRHQIEFVYAPKSFMVGVGLTCLGLITSGLLMVMGWQGSSKSASPGQLAC